MICKIVTLIILCALSAAESGDSQSLNDRPIIGVLAQEISYALNNTYPNEYDSYIAASYVKLVEGAGGRVVPVWIGKDKDYYANVIRKTNGILFPGGATYFNQKNGYAEAGMMLYSLAIEENKKGVVYPLLGICLGMELLIYAATGGKEYRDDCDAISIALPMKFRADFDKSRMWKTAPKDVIDVLEHKNITANYHKYCITEEGLRKFHIENDWKVLSTSVDRRGLEFIASFEHASYPFFGVQYHPEKNLYEWGKKDWIVHSGDAIRSSQYMANTFMDYCRQNDHRFEDQHEEKESLIYNYELTYTGIRNVSYEQCFLFKKQ